MDESQDNNSNSDEGLEDGEILDENEETQPKDGPSYRPDFRRGRAKGKKLREKQRRINRDLHSHSHQSSYHNRQKLTISGRFEKLNKSIGRPSPEYAQYLETFTRSCRTKSRREADNECNPKLEIGSFRRSARQHRSNKHLLKDQALEYVSFPNAKKIEPKPNLKPIEFGNQVEVHGEISGEEDNDDDGTIVHDNKTGDTEDISADEMNETSRESSIIIVDNKTISVCKTPEIITLDATDTSDGDVDEVSAEVDMKTNTHDLVNINETAIDSDETIFDDDLLMEVEDKPDGNGGFVGDLNCNGIIANENIEDGDNESTGMVPEDVDLEMESGEPLHNLSDEEIDVLELRNRLLSDLVSKTEISSSSNPPIDQSPQIEPEQVQTESINAEDTCEKIAKIEKNNSEDEAEALRAVVLSTCGNRKTKHSKKANENSCAAKVNQVKTSEAKGRNAKSIFKQNSTTDDEDRRSSVSSTRSRRNSNPNPSSRTRPSSPPPSTRRRYSQSRQSSTSNNRRSSRENQRNTRERSRQSPVRNQRKRNAGRTASLSPSPPPPLPRDRHSSTRTKTNCINSRSRSKGTSSTPSLPNITNLPKDDLRKQLMKSQKRASMKPNSPNQLMNIEFSPNEIPTETETNNMKITIRKTVDFTNDGNGIVTIASASPTTLGPNTSNGIDLVSNARNFQDHPNHLGVASPPISSTIMQAGFGGQSLLPALQRTNELPAYQRSLQVHPSPLQQIFGLRTPSVTVPGNSVVRFNPNSNLQYNFNPTGIGSSTHFETQRTITTTINNPSNQWVQCFDVPNNVQRKVEDKQCILTKTIDGLNMAKKTHENSSVTIDNNGILSVAKTIIPTMPSSATTTRVVVLKSDQHSSSPKSLHSSSPYASPVLSPSVNYKMEKPGIRSKSLQKSASVPVTSTSTKTQSFKRLIIPVRDGDSTSDEMDDDEKTVKKRKLSDGEKLIDNNDFQKALDELLKRARDASEKHFKDAEAIEMEQGSGEEEFDNVNENGIPSSSLSISSSSKSPSLESSEIVVKPAVAASSNKEITHPLTTKHVGETIPSVPNSENVLFSELEPCAPNSTKEIEIEIAQGPVVGPQPEEQQKVSDVNAAQVNTMTNIQTQTEGLGNTITQRDTSAENKIRPAAKQNSSSENSLLPPIVTIDKSITKVIEQKVVRRTIQKRSKVVATIKNATLASAYAPVQPATGSIIKVASGHPSPPTGSKQIIDDLTRKIIESRDQLALSAKERELLQSRQLCFDGLKDLYKSIQQHTRLSAMDIRLESEKASLQKRLEELKKRQVDVRSKASVINKSIREKSKLVLPTKARCISLEREVNVLGKKIIGDRHYKVTDLFTKDIQQVVRDISALHSRQPSTSKLERGVVFHQVISDMDLSSTLGQKKVVSVNSRGHVTPKPPNLSVSVATINTNTQRNVRKPNPSTPNHSAGGATESIAKEQQPSTQQTVCDRDANVAMEVAKDKVPNKMGFLTRHGSMDEDSLPESTNLASRDKESATLKFADGDILTELKPNANQAALIRIIDVEIQSITRPGSSIIKLDPHTELCPDNLLDGVCLKVGCTLQHI